MKGIKGRNFFFQREKKKKKKKTRVKVRFYRGSYGCMRVEPFDQFTLIHTVLRRVSNLKGTRRNIQNGGIIFNLERRLKKRKKKSFQTIDLP